MSGLHGRVTFVQLTTKGTPSKFIRYGFDDWPTLG